MPLVTRLASHSMRLAPARLAPKDTIDARMESAKNAVSSWSRGLCPASLPCTAVTMAAAEIRRLHRKATVKPATMALHVMFCLPNEIQCNICPQREAHWTSTFIDHCHCNVTTGMPANHTARTLEQVWTLAPLHDSMAMPLYRGAYCDEHYRKHVLDACASR